MLKQILTVKFSWPTQYVVEVFPGSLRTTRQFFDPHPMFPQKGGLNRGKGRKIISGRLAWLPFSHQSAVPGRHQPGGGSSPIFVYGCEIIA